ncbi:MAG: CapA family protein [Lachnospiraceae bacterium]|nr:CapA family protein [Lachnospiraceae bacterium]
MKRRKKTALGILSVSILILALVIAGGIYFRWDENIINLVKEKEDETTQEESLENQSEESETPGEESQEMEEVLEEKDSKTTVVFTGDVELSTYAQKNYDAKGIDGLVTEPLRSELTGADLLEINNEFCFSTRGVQAPDKQYTFRVNPSYVSVLTDLGVDVAGLANNHVLDFGHDALLDTFTTLTDAGVEYTGAGNSLSDASKLVVKEVNGKKIGFLAASRVIPVASWNVENSQPGVFTCYDTTALCNSISEAKSQVDYLFVCVHWGTEHTDVLTDYQKPNAHAYIDAGADGVIGAHSHCLQGIEYYNGKPIFYSLGNFIFNETIDSTMAVKFTISSDDQVSVQLLPATASGATTSLASEEKATSIYNYLQGISPTVTIGSDGTLSQ